MKKLDGVILLVLGCIIALFTINCVVGVHFGVQYFFLSMAAELIICGLLIIKISDKKMNINLNNKFTLAMLAVGLASVVSAVNAIIDAYFGIQYFFALLSAEYVICILLLIKSDDKTEDKL